jgi:hypothetical protein
MKTDLDKDQTPLVPQIGLTGATLRQFYAGLIYAALIITVRSEDTSLLRRIAVEEADLLLEETKKGNDQ